METRSDQAAVLGAGIEETRDRHGAFPRLTTSSSNVCARSASAGPSAPASPLPRGRQGHRLLRRSSPGTAVVMQGYGHENRVLGIHGRRRFLGELNLLSGSPTYVSAIVRDDGEVMRSRRSGCARCSPTTRSSATSSYGHSCRAGPILIDIGAGVKVVGSRYSRDARRVREFLARNRMPYQWMDVEEDVEAEAVLAASVSRRRDARPDQRATARCATRPTARSRGSSASGRAGHRRALCDLVIVGAGPAGLAAAVYGATEGLDTQVIDSVAVRRPGEHLLADRELPRVPDRHLGQRAGGARDHPGAAGSARAWSCPPRRSR